MVAFCARSPCSWWNSVLFCTILICPLFFAADTQNISAPATLNIGALVAFSSVIGQVAKQALELAVADINRDGTILNGSKVVLQMLDTNCSAFQGAAAAMELLKKEVVAVAGPQSSAVSHFVAHMGGSTQVPLVSFAATDPALSEYQYRYFFRIAHSDAVQMEAIAALIGFYGWREVVALYTDDDFGTNGAAALSDALVPTGARIVQKAALDPSINRTAIGSVLTELAAMQSRIFVVHMSQNVAFVLFSEARYLGMMTPGYVWIVTDAVAAAVGSTQLDADVVSSMQGVIGTRGHVSDSPKLRSFISEWNNQQIENKTSDQFLIYGLYAYDSLWMIAYALDSYLRDGLKLTFQEPIIPPSDAGGASELSQLKVFKGGPVLRMHLLKTKFNGTSGFIQVNPKGDLIRTAFEFVNMVGSEMQVVGYWTNESQISVSPPDGISLASTALSNISLHIVWPGNTTQTPRGWVLPKNGRPLRIAVPNKSGFKQFVSWSLNSSSVSEVHGFCIDVFEEALTYLPYAVSYTFVPFGYNSTPVYDDMIDQLTSGVFDAVVGDVTITTKRLEKVDFSQPYTESGLVVVVPVRDSQSNYAWAFLRPFTPTMWLTTLAFFIFTGIVVWLLEHKKNRDFRGHPKKQVVTVLWFTFSTLFFSHREKTKSTLGRFVIIMWLFVVLIITSSYTANLTSILTVQQLTPTIQGISSLQASNVPIGYQTGSFVQDYLISLNIQKERLKPLSTMAAYAKALNMGPDKGGVAAIVDELPYIQVFLGTQCGFTIAGQEFTKAGWGFAFPKDSELAIDMSAAILTLSENGQLQRLHDMWLMTDQCGSPISQVQSNQLSLSSFWGLFLVTGLASVTSLLVYMFRLLWQFLHKANAIDQSRSFSSRSTRFIKSFASYIDESSINPRDTKELPNSDKSNGRKQLPDQSILQIKRQEPDSDINLQDN